MTTDELNSITWRTSSYTGANGNCVEIGWPAEAGVAVRDSKERTGPTLAFPTTAWRTFLHAQDGQK